MNQPHNLVALVTLLALVFYIWTTLGVGGARGRHKVDAPAMTGPPEFERAVRIHQNTLEGLALFLPSLWLFALYWNERVAAGVGLVWIVGRIIYAVGYASAAKNRSAGFLIQSAASMFLLIGAIVGAIMAIATVGFI